MKSLLSAEEMIQRNDAEELFIVPISVGLYGEDPEWAAAICKRLARHPAPAVRGNAILGFGHLARRFGKLDQSSIKPLIESALVDSDSWVRGQADSAADDVHQFLGWSITRKEKRKSPRRYSERMHKKLAAKKRS